MAITAQQVKELRERTWIWMMECKKALLATNWDMEKAIEELRKKGLAKAAKKADRETSEWGILIEVDNKKTYIVSVACETDFLANSDKFKVMLKDLVKYLRENWDNKEEAQEYINKNYALELWENLKLKDFQIISWDAFGSYIHSNGKLAALVVAKWDNIDLDKLKQVAMHITATNPEYLKLDDISNTVKEKEKEIQLEIMSNDPKMSWKPKEVLEKIIEWKLNKTFWEITLLEQNFVINPELKVKDFIWKDTIDSFYRFYI